MPGSSRTWTIKGVSDRTREAALEAALGADLTVGAWIDRALAKAAEEARHPRPPAATREEMAKVVWELLNERRAPLVEGIGRTSAAAPGDGASPAAVRARLWQRRAL